MAVTEGAAQRGRGTRGQPAITDAEVRFMEPCNPRTWQNVVAYLLERASDAYLAGGECQEWRDYCDAYKSVVASTKNA